MTEILRFRARLVANAILVLVVAGLAHAEKPDGSWQEKPDGTWERFLSGMLDDPEKKSGHAGHHSSAHHHHDGMGMYEVTRYPNRGPTDEERARAADLVQKTRAAAEKNGWFDYERASAAGFALLPGLDHLHFGKKEFLADGRVLDPERPEFLMFYDTPEGKRLTGVMFLEATPEGHGPQVGGPLTVWHYHTWPPQCQVDGTSIAPPREDGTCERGVLSPRSPEMLHVWFVEHPEGPFATEMQLAPEIVSGLPKEK